MGQLGTTVADDSRDDIEPDLYRSRTVLRQPHGRGAPDPRLLRRRHGLRGKPPPIRSPGLDLAEHDQTRLPSDQIHLDATRAEVARDVETLRLVESGGGILTISAEQGASVHARDANERL